MTCTLPSSYKQCLPKLNPKASSPNTSTVGSWVVGRITHCLKNTLFDNCTRPAVLRTSQCWEVESCSLGLLGALEDTLFCVGDCQSVDEYIRWLGA